MNDALTLTTLFPTDPSQFEKPTAIKPKPFSQNEISVSTSFRHMIFNRMAHARCLPKPLKIQYNSPKTTGLPETTFIYFKQILLDSIVSPVKSSVHQSASKVQNFFTSIKEGILNKFHQLITHIKNSPNACKQALLNRVVFPIGSAIKSQALRIQAILAAKIKNFIGTTCKNFFLNRVISPIGSGIKSLAIKAQNAFNTALPYIWPVNPNQQVDSNFTKTVFDNACDAYLNGKKIDEVNKSKAVKALSIAKPLKEKVKWVSDETVEVVESLKIMKVIRFVHTALNYNLSLNSAIQMPRMQEKIKNKVMHALGIPNPTGDAARIHANRCGRIADTAKIAIYFAVKDVHLAQNISVVTQTFMVFAENYPEIQDYIPEIPVISKSFRTINKNLDLAYNTVRDGIARPAVKKFVMPKLINAIRPFVNQLPALNINQQIANNLGNSHLGSFTNFLFKSYAQEPSTQIIENRLKYTENLIADVILSVTVNQVKSLVLKQFTKHLVTATPPMLVVKSMSFIKIISPAVNAIAMIAEGGSEQSIGELSVRVSGVAVMVMSGSVFLGTALIYGCFATGHIINMREQYLKENEIEDPIYTDFFENKNAQTDDQKQANFDYYQCVISSIASVIFS